MNKYRDLGDVGAVGIEFVLSIAVGYYGGRWLDGHWFGGRGYLTFAGFVFGLILAFKAIWDASKRANRRMEQIEREERAVREPSLEELKAKIERHERRDRIEDASTHVQRAPGGDPDEQQR